MASRRQVTQFDSSINRRGKQLGVQVRTAIAGASDLQVKPTKTLTSDSLSLFFISQ